LALHFFGREVLSLSPEQSTPLNCYFCLSSVTFCFGSVLFRLMKFRFYAFRVANSSDTVKKSLVRWTLTGTVGGKESGWGWGAMAMRMGRMARMRWRTWGLTPKSVLHFSYLFFWGVWTNFASSIQLTGCLNPKFKIK